jgi:hypothetical protein
VFEAVDNFGAVVGTALHIHGDVAFATWTADGVTFGTDTFVVRDGKIAYQTAAVALA